MLDEANLDGREPDEHADRRDRGATSKQGNDITDWPLTNKRKCKHAKGDGKRGKRQKHQRASESRDALPEMELADQRGSVG